jgi:hypothetical protein
MHSGKCNVPDIRLASKRIVLLGWIRQHRRGSKHYRRWWSCIAGFALSLQCLVCAAQAVAPKYSTKGDEPPCPLNGLGTTLDVVRKGQEKLRAAQR